MSTIRDIFAFAFLIKICVAPRMFMFREYSLILNSTLLCIPPLIWRAVPRVPLTSLFSFLSLSLSLFLSLIIPNKPNEAERRRFVGTDPTLFLSPPSTTATVINRKRRRPRSKGQLDFDAFILQYVWVDIENYPLLC
jgi:hypothetical protein